MDVMEKTRPSRPTTSLVCDQGPLDGLALQAQGDPLAISAVRLTHDAHPDVRLCYEPDRERGLVDGVVLMRFEGFEPIVEGEQ